MSCLIIFASQGQFLIVRGRHEHLVELIRNVANKIAFCDCVVFVCFDKKKWPADKMAGIEKVSLAVPLLRRKRNWIVRAIQYLDQIVFLPGLFCFRLHRRRRTARDTFSIPAGHFLRQNKQK